MDSSIENVEINYNGKRVKGKKLIVSSELNIDINTAWHVVQQSSLLEFVSKGKVKFKPIDNEFPTYWKEDIIIKTKILIYGFIPFGGTHSIKFIKIDHNNFTLSTEEKNVVAKIWNHGIYMEHVDENRIKYTDKIDLYAGILTGFVVKWVKSFYEHRQKRWKIKIGEINK